MTDGQIFDQVFGSASSRILPILGGQAVWDPFQTDELQFIQQEFGPPPQYIYAMAVAPYIGETGTITSSTSLSTLFADMQSYFTTTYIPSVTTNVALAKQYGVPLAAYEGGQGLDGHQGSGPIFNLEYQAQNDPRMYQLYVEMIDEWEQAGGGLFNAFQLNGGGNAYGYWGLLTTANSVGSQKYDALLSTILPPGMPTLTGSWTTPTSRPSRPTTARGR